MKKLSIVDVQISKILKKMKKAMPEVRRQVGVYEQNVKKGLMVKSIKEASQFENV